MLCDLISMAEKFLAKWFYDLGISNSKFDFMVGGAS